MLGLLPPAKEPPDRRCPPPPLPPELSAVAAKAVDEASSSTDSLAELSPPEPLSPAHSQAAKDDSVDSSYASSSEDFPTTSSGGARRRSSASFQAISDAVSRLYRLDDFQHELLGDGYFSHVYKVAHPGSSDVMVLKRFKPGRSTKESDLAEIQLLRRLSHPNLIRLRGVCVEVAVEAEEGCRWRLHALTEYCEGGNLDAFIQGRAKPLGWKARVSLCLDIGRGMEHVHGLGFLHRDLTAVNVLLKREPGRLTAVVADFGLAVRLPKPGERLSPVTGNPYWQAPECLVEKAYDAAADVFSFGIICLQVIGWIQADPEAGFPRTSSFGVDYLRFPAPDGTPPGLLSLAFSACLMDPAARPPFAAAVYRLLDVWSALHSTASALERSRSHTNFRRPEVAANFATAGIPAFAHSFSSQPPKEKIRSRLERRTAPEVVSEALKEAVGGGPRKLSLASASATAVEEPRKTSALVAESMAAADPFYEPSTSANPFADAPHDRYLRRPTTKAHHLPPSPFLHSFPVNADEEEDSNEEETAEEEMEEVERADVEAEAKTSPPRRPPLHGHAKSGLVPMSGGKDSSDGGSTASPGGLRKCHSFPASPPPRLPKKAEEETEAETDGALPPADALKEVAVGMSARDEAFVDPVAEKARRSTLRAGMDPPSPLLSDRRRCSDMPQSPPSLESSEDVGPVMAPISTPPPPSPSSQPRSSRCILL